jgi:alpha-amylase/alpha-mannosidase (GH57 family)
VSRPETIKVALLWHMHQPNYQEPGTRRLAMPWVRLHGLKDYLDMPLAATARENIRVTFNLVPTLLDQLQLYVDGAVDRHLELSRMRADELSAENKLEILNSFFLANPTRMIVPFPRYRDLFQKYTSAASDPSTLVSLFSSEEIRDLQVWSNLVWVDPLFRVEEPVRRLFAQARQFTEEDKQELLVWQISLIARIVPTYQKLLAEDRLEISFTPYYHPILPLLSDTDVAREALPSIDLPRKRFVHPEDAERQVAMSAETYRNLFGREMTGMWPSEGSVSEEVLAIAARHGIKWLASDEEVLTHSLGKSGLWQKDNPIHAVYEFPSGIKMLFRDHALSDRVGFVYSTWEAPRAASDFVEHIKRLRTIYRGQLDRTVIPIILDGENAWEYFRDDGTEFLRLLYEQLEEDEEIETVTFSEALATVPARKLPRLFAGSWINHNFRIWIGHSEDNAAWDLLGTAREDLVTFEKENPGFDREILARAWKQIYIAEGSDWCWWYGDDHRSGQDDQFDRLFRKHLAAVYELTGRDVPLDLFRPISQPGGMPRATMPDGLVTPILDGSLTHFYEWAGAGHFDCRQPAGAMHRVDRAVTDIFFGYDRDRFYIRLDLRSRNVLEFMAGRTVVLALFVPEKRVFELVPVEQFEDPVSSAIYAFGDRVEFSVRRTNLWSDGFGDLSFTVTLKQGGQILETWPEHEPIALKIPRRFEEVFWPT